MRGTSAATSRVRTAMPFWAIWTASLLEKPTMASTLPPTRAACWVKPISWMVTSDSVRPAVSRASWRAYQVSPVRPGTPTVRPASWSRPVIGESWGTMRQAG